MPKPPLRKPRHATPLPVDRLPPFIFVPDEPGRAGRLVAPFPLRRGGLTTKEKMAIQYVATQLGNRLPDGLSWIDPASGTASPATIGEGQLQRRLLDLASVSIRLRF